MALSPEQRKAVSEHCLPMSWQMLSAWRVRNLGSLNDGPELVADWLADANQASQTLAQEMLRFMGERLWRIESPPEKAADAAGLRPVNVRCGGLCWTLWLQPRPQLHVLRISR